MGKFNVISSDSHVFEPADLWTTRIEPKYRDRAPHIEKGKDFDRWILDETKSTGLGQGIQTGLRFTNPGAITLQGRLEEIPPATYEPHQHLKDMELDGLDGEVVFPTIGLNMYKVTDSELLSAIFRAYNDWLSDFCSYYPHRIKGIAMINVDDVDDAIQELQRCRKMGLSGAMISEYPTLDARDHRGYEQPKYESLWATAQDLDMPLNMHVATLRVRSEEIEFKDDTTNDAVLGASGLSWICYEVQREHWVRRSITAMIFSGVFERYPKLRLGIVEHELSWIPNFLWRMEEVYHTRQVIIKNQFKNAMTPSDFFHHNCYAGFQEDAAGILCRDIIGVDNILWGNDYPHSESTFPRSQEILEKILAGVPQQERAKIVGGNTARIYHFD